MHATVNLMSNQRTGATVIYNEREIFYDVGLRLKGSGAVNDVQLKFVDASGDNVWWVNRPHATLPGRLIDWRLRPRHLGFAWGPTTDQRLRRTLPQGVDMVPHQPVDHRWFAPVILSRL